MLGGSGTGVVNRDAIRRMLPLAICSRATALLRRDNDKNGFSSLTQRTNGMATVTTKDGVEIFLALFCLTQ